MDSGLVNVTIKVWKRDHISISFNLKTKNDKVHYSHIKMDWSQNDIPWYKLYYFFLFIPAYAQMQQS